MVRDRIVVGINDPRIQRSLLQEIDITFDNAFKIAQSMELSAKESSMIQAGLPREQPVRVQQQQSRSRQTSAPSHCYRCGSHPSATSRFRQAECCACGKLGHIARVCRSKPTGHSQPKSQKSG